MIYAFTKFDSGNWIPVTWLSFELDSTVFGFNSTVLHAMKLLWHTLHVCLLFCVLRPLTGSLIPTALVAAIFAVHPLHVESVAWASERKDVLSACALLVTLIL